jgi:threonine/homoserine/homoserine lactone efflux protein
VLSVLINPAAWIFLATTASALLAAAGGSGGRAYAFVTAAAMLAGVMIVDGSTVALGAGGRRYLTRRATVALGIILSAAMAAIAGWLLFQGATG